jgi:hypothetical protein
MPKLTTTLPSSANVVGTSLRWIATAQGAFPFALVT